MEIDKRSNMEHHAMLAAIPTIVVVSYTINRF